MTKRNATIQDVARSAGVSTATVSRVLSKPDLVTEKTRTAVFNAVKSTRYRINRAAQNLRMQRAGAVLVLVPNLGKPFFSQILSGISDGFAESGLSVLITDTESRPLSGGDLAGRFLDGTIDGVISLDGDVDQVILQHCQDANVADRIVFTCEWVDDPTFPSIRSDNAKGAQLAIRHLHDLGHRKIAHVTGPKGNVLTESRRKGMLEERSRLNLRAPKEWIIRGDFTLESGQRAADLIAAMPDKPTAVFCAADMVAFGLISGLKSHGLSVPEDISVVGFDDIEMSGSFVPSLTTIRQDRHRIGLLSAEKLLDRIGGATGEALIEVIDVELVVRESTAPPKA
jgi:LacI family repressor for deo operon, udp, cdd, tsx, nupC, and nupG